MVSRSCLAGSLGLLLLAATALLTSDLASIAAIPTNLASYLAQVSST